MTNHITNLAQLLCEKDGYSWDCKDFTETPNGETVEDFHNYYLDHAETAYYYLTNLPSPPPTDEPGESAGDKLIRAILTAYHTTRIGGTPVTAHIQSKSYVQSAFCNYTKRIAELEARCK